MKLNELRELLDRLESINPEVRIVVSNLSTILGPTPTVGIDSVNIGFDWNTNNVLITPDVELCKVDTSNERALEKAHLEISRLNFMLTASNYEIQRLSEDITSLHQANLKK